MGRSFIKYIILLRGEVIYVICWVIRVFYIVLFIYLFLIVIVMYLINNFISEERILIFRF